eukprot:125310-Chlamydomonas_euryale.AAC.2
MAESVAECGRTLSLVHPGAPGLAGGLWSVATAEAGPAPGPRCPIAPAAPAAGICSKLRAGRLLRGGQPH